jgi:glycosyltransferase involved in cell wall biosynthesis
MSRLGIRVIPVPGLPPAGSAAFYAGALANLASPWPYSVARHHTARYARTLERLVAAEAFDLLHCEWTPYASYCRHARQLPALLMAHNIETTVWRRRTEHAGNPPERLYMGLQAAKMERFEKRAFRQAARVAVVTAEEAATAGEWGARAVSLISNGVDTDALSPRDDRPEPDSVLFMGSLDWQPNRDALLYLVDQIWPLVRAAHPAATLNVVGRQPAPRLRERVESVRGVQWVGEVPDIRPWVARANMLLVPLRIGGGSRIKILETLAMGKAVVTTSIGAEGLSVTDGRDCRIADEPAAFARTVVDLLHQPAVCRALGESGRRLVVSRYDWRQLAAELGRAWNETASSRAGTR